MKQTINCVIIDDDQSAIRILEDHIAEFPHLKISKTFTRPVEALSELSYLNDIDLIFLDIDMPGITGIEIAKSLKGHANNIIFTTAHDRYAKEAFDVRAKHFLLKPIELSVFAQEVNKVIDECFNQDRHDADENEDTIFLRPGERGTLNRITQEAIVYIQAAGNYIHVYTEEEHFTIYMTIKETENILNKKNQFYRVHKSYMINCAYITKVVGNTVYLGKHPIPMSSPYKSDFVAFLNRRTWISKRI